jgi:hypothetical protein
MNDSNGTAATEGHAEMGLVTSFDEDVSAEIAAVTMAIVKAIAELASLSIDKRPYLSRILDAGLREFEEMDHPHTLNEHGGAFLVKAKAHYVDLIATMPAP